MHFKRFLIVEDNAQMRSVLRSFVADLADEVTECEDGSQAFALYSKLLPEWVLMDIELPGLDGISALRQIKATYPQARVMIVTDYDDASLREAARQAGACEYVVKENLLELRRLLDAGTKH